MGLGVNRSLPQVHCTAGCLVLLRPHTCLCEGLQCFQKTSFPPSKIPPLEAPSFFCNPNTCRQAHRDTDTHRASCLAWKIASNHQCSRVSCKWHMLCLAVFKWTRTHKYTLGKKWKRCFSLPFEGLLCLVCREENVPITAPIATATWVRGYNFVFLPPPSGKKICLKYLLEGRGGGKAKHCSSAFSKH